MSYFILRNKEGERELMELITISEITKAFKVSTRTLRYYEEIGLIESQRKEDYAYRVYDQKAIGRLQQIIVLRKLNISLKEIKEMLDQEDIRLALGVFKKHIRDINSKVEALNIIKRLLQNLSNQLERKQHLEEKLNLLGEESILSILDAFSLNTFNPEEEKNMEELSKATENLQKLKDVRIVHLPACTVASCHYIGENPEKHVGDQLDKFIRESNLYDIKPDARVFGFNHPNPSKDQPVYGYEFWVTIPKDMEVPDYVTKKEFKGGLYAAHMIVLGNFHEWQWLTDWVTMDNPKYESNTVDDGGQCMYGLLEEGLNFLYNSKLNWPDSDENQLDLLYPIKLREAKTPKEDIK